MGFVAVTASVLATASFQLRQWEDLFELSPTLVVSLSILAGAVGGTLGFVIFCKALRFRRFRNFALGSLNVEGDWFLQTFLSRAGEGNGLSDSSPLLKDGVLRLEYLVEQGEISVVTTRINAENTGTFGTTSLIAYTQARGGTVRYLNYFDLNPDGPKKDGLSEGRFTVEKGAAQEFHAAIVVLADGDLMRQKGRRIPSEAVLRLETKFGEDNWREEFLRAEGTSVTEKLRSLSKEVLGGEPLLPG